MEMLLLTYPSEILTSWQILNTFSKNKYKSKSVKCFLIIIAQGIERYSMGSIVMRRPKIFQIETKKFWKNLVVD